jgi:hypothetical protein
MVRMCGECRDFSSGGEFSGLCEQLGSMRLYEDSPKPGECTPLEMVL